MGTTSSSRPERKFIALAGNAGAGIMPLKGDLVAVGGELNPASLLAAYRSGIFPWYEDDSPVLWWSPHPRAILEFDALRLSRRLRRTIRSGRFHVTFDRDFAAVIRACAGGRREGTWLTADMIRAYIQLHEIGHASSVEVWRANRLAGGLYGVLIGRYFSAESMFHAERDASKVALAALIERLRGLGFTWLDLQVLNDHTRRLGGREIPRAAFLRRLEEAVRAPAALPPAGG
jgi:leucyl/phenylalanyl-tRNA--protein transferase